MLPNYTLAQNVPENEPDIKLLKQGRAYVYKLYPENIDGMGYKLVYLISAPLEAYWKFKTDFENDFLLTNKLISKHRLLKYKDNVAITENVYATKPGVRFRWRTMTLPNRHRLEFELQNPQECGKKFHYGHIQLKAAGDYTIVTQVAYFNFFGAALWMNYPWYGGMRYYLEYTARWEQETIIRLIDNYR
ncbi:MAG: hypothetical protein PVF37_06840 [Desulfobacterales bacterium]